MFEADCRHCRRSFPIPLLGDFSYGQFVLHGERGGVFGYLSAFECPSFEDIHSRLLVIAGQQEFTRAESSRFQEVMASCADEISGQPLGLEPVCPFCRSHDLNYGDSKPLDDGEIRVVTFTGFQSLSDTAKTQKLTELWKQ
jgi:hypothetical protein